VGELRIRRLSKVLRHRRVLLLETGGASYVCHLSFNLRWIRDLDHAHRFMHDHRLGVPRLVASATGAAEVARHGTGFVLREHVGGTPCDLACPPDTLRKVAEAYAAVHRVCADRWGHPRGTPGAGPSALERPLEAWRGTIRELQDLEGPGTEAAAETALRRLVQMQPHGRDPGGYRLVHGDCNFKNILLTPNGKVCLIDLETVHFGFPPLEVTHLLLQLCRTDAGRWTAFLEAYLGALDARGREAWERDAAFWLAGGLLTRVRWHLMRYRIESADGRVREFGWRLDAARRYWQEVKRVLEAAASGPFAWTDAAGSIWAEEFHVVKSVP
jgi:aminoglycoside phosphotransferase (APT) family kinase protein